MARGNGRDVPEHLLKNASIEEVGTELVYLLHSTRRRGSLRRRHRWWICSVRGAWPPGPSTCASRCPCLSPPPYTPPVVQCDHVLLRPLLRLHLPLQRGALHELHAQVASSQLIIPSSVFSLRSPATSSASLSWTAGVAGLFLASARYKALTFP